MTCFTLRIRQYIPAFLVKVEALNGCYNILCTIKWFDFCLSRTLRVIFKRHVSTQGTLELGHKSTQSTLAREHLSPQGTLVLEYVITEDTLARNHAWHVSTQDTLHVSPQASKASEDARYAGKQGTLEGEHVSTQGTSVRGYVSMPGKLALSNVRQHKSTQFSRHV